MMRAAVARLALVTLTVACPAWGENRASGDAANVARPIIAGILADPARYLGRRVEIYGLVVRTDAEGTRFHLQDVSQRPMLVLAPSGRSAAKGDQLIVRGVLRRVDGEIELLAERITPARVTGGGCC